MNGLKPNARIRVKQDVDFVLKKMKLKILRKPHEEMLMMTDSRYQHYLANEDRIFHKDGLLFRKYFREARNGECQKLPNFHPETLNQ